MFVVTDGNAPAEKEHLMTIKRENKRKGTRPSAGVEGLSQTGNWQFPILSKVGAVTDTVGTGEGP